MKWVKRGLVAIAILVLFIVSAMIAVVMLVDPNDYKDQIAAAFTDATGRVLHIEGNSRLSVFPWLGLELNQVSLDNPPGFQDDRFLQVQRLNIKVAVLPLFASKVRVGEIQLFGMQANLERRADGVTNWDDLIGGGEAETPVDHGSGQTAPEKGVALIPLRDFYVGGIDIQDAGITWHDAKAGTLTHIEYFNLKTGSIRFGATLPFSMKFALRNEQPKIVAGVELSGRVSFDPVAQRYALNDLDLNLQASGTVFPGNDQKISASIKQLQADLQQQTLEVKGVDIRSSDMAAGVNVVAHDILTDNLKASGDIDLTVPSLRQLLIRMQQPVPLTADEDVMGRLQLKARFNGNKSGAQLSELSVQLDDSSLSGELEISNFTQPAYRFAITLDQINADRYLPPPLTDEPEQAVDKSVEPADPELPLPVAALRELKADGKLNIGTMQVMNLHVAGIEAGLKAAGGKVALKPLNLKAYDGAFSGGLLLDVTGEKPAYNVNLDLSAMQIGPLLQDYMAKRLIDGALNANGELTTMGNRVSELKANLNGTLDLAFKDGALSTDARQRLRERKAELQQKLSGKPVNTRTPVGEPTKYSSITAKALIKNGVVTNDDLEVRARHMYVTGKGRFELPSNYIDYVLTILLSDDGAGQDDSLNDLVDFPIDYHLKGKLEVLDYAKIATRALTGAVQAKFKRGVEAEKQAARQKLEREKAQLAEQKRLAEEKKKAEVEQKKKEAEEAMKKKLEKKKNKLLNRLFD